MQSSFFTSRADQRTALVEALDARPSLVVGLCAAWCNTCGEFMTGFEQVARSSPDKTFLWLDIEDDADLVGDVEVENFPTLAIYEDGRLVHFGTSLPQQGVLARLVASFSPESRAIAGDDAVVALPRTLRSPI